jgi:hypothetical protein
VKSIIRFGPCLTISDLLPLIISSSTNGIDLSSKPVYYVPTFSLSIKVDNSEVWGMYSLFEIHFSYNPIVPSQNSLAHIFKTGLIQHRAKGNCSQSKLLLNGSINVPVGRLLERNSWVRNVSSQVFSQVHVGTQPSYEENCLCITSVRGPPEAGLWYIP